ncbi:hypothetical protein LCGC14_2463550 [marine sediment metagenome]|uniref:Uncharacterized protein n=1 Tax=marine sediment metagenome TaxID=412755 RepID=A0A0F9BD17_9ZZZZ
MRGLNVNHSALEFFKIVEEMIDSGSTCSEILKKINMQPSEIKSLFEGMPLIFLKLGRDNVLKDQFTEVKIGIGRSLEEAIKTAPPYKPNDFDLFEIFFKNAIKNLKKIKKVDSG